MQRNSLSNINDNKVLQDNLTTQMSTQKKINRASDDPVIAIRALRLRSNVTEVTQYYSKNIPDAESWLKITEDALKSTSSVVTSMIEQATRGSNGDLTSEERKIIIEQLKALGEEVYKTGDASYAGRYVFTGYRTDTSLSFQQDTKNTTYNLTEQLDKTAIDQIKHVNIGALSDWTNANYATDANVSAMNETLVSTADVYRFRLAYNDIDEVEPVITYTDTAGNQQTITADDTVLSNDTSTYAPDPYTYISQNPGKVLLVRDTGELLIGKDIYDSLMATKDDPTTSLKNEAEIRITYEKTNFTGNDLRPEHYYACKATTWETDASGNYVLDGGGNKIPKDLPVNPIEYNQDYLKGVVDKQSIEYDVGFNQTIRVNSTADESYNLGIGREVDDLVSALQRVVNLEDLKKNIENKIKVTTDENDLTKLKNQLTATEKALTFEKDTCQKRFEKGITSFQGFLDDTSLAITNVGTRSSKLELIESRMQNQKTTFETLKSKNEDIDITEVAIHLSSAELTYSAALQATGKIIQNTLLSYL